MLTYTICIVVLLLYLVFGDLLWKVNSTGENQVKLFLLLFDNDLGDYYLHSVFDDTEESWDYINKMTYKCDILYRVIRGEVVDTSKVDQVDDGE